MSRVTYTCTDSAGEYTDDDGTMNITATQYELSSGITSDYNDVGFRFESIVVPQGATIRAAFLEVYATNYTTNSSKDFGFRGEDTDDSAAFTTTTSELSNRTTTTAISPTNDMEEDTASRYHPWDVTDVVQEIVDRGGWASGNDMMFTANAGSSSAICTLQTDAGANVPHLTIIYDTDTTGELSPSANAIGTSPGFTNPTNAYSSNDSYATYEGDPSNPSHVYYDFGISDLSGATIDDIVISVEGKASSTNDDHKYAYELSWNGGTNWTTEKFSGTQWPTSDKTHRRGGGYDGYSHTFVPSDLTDANFRVRLSSPDDTDNNTISIDHVTIEVLSFIDTVTDSVTKSLSYNVQTTDSVTKSMSYSITRDMATDRFFTTFGGATEVAITKNLQYNVASQDSVTKSMTYSVTITPSAITKSLAYEVTASDSVTKSMQYVVVAPASISKNLQYTITPLKVYSREDNASLPTDTADLTVSYSSSEIIDVDTSDDALVGHTGTDSDFVLHLYKIKHIDNNSDDVVVSWEGQTNIPPSAKTVYLQIYNYNSTSWETLDSDSSSVVDIDFTLSGTIAANNTNYYDGAFNEVAVRVYQQA